MQDQVRNVYMDVPDRRVIRTADVYQTQTEIGTRGYSDKLLSIVADFKNSGVPEGCNAEGMAGKSKRGEVACQLFAVINPDTHVIEHIGFRSRGCLAMTGCASEICVLACGLTIEEALKLSPADVVRAVDGVPADKNDTPVFAVEALHAAIGDFLLANGGLEAVDRVAPCDQDAIDCLLCEHCSLRDLRIQWLVDHR